MTDKSWFVRSIITFGFVLFGLSRVARTAVAQGTRVVAGQVTDSSTRAGLSGVRVSVVGTTIATSTDATGRYALDVPAGRDSIAFARIGYKRVVAADRKSTRLNSSHVAISYAVFCLKKKKK